MTDGNSNHLPYVCILKFSDYFASSFDGSVILGLDVAQHLTMLAELFNDVLEHFPVYLRSRQSHSSIRIRAEGSQFEETES